MTTPEQAIDQLLHKVSETYTERGVDIKRVETEEGLNRVALLLMLEKGDFGSETEEQIIQIGKMYDFLVGTRRNE